ncbi:MAG: phosphoribosylformylglycinamidine synthase I [Bacteroidales bacterium]|nr:phosphoribosylformylglycinamidine synthase I [Bacteroidales bacterium]
MKAGILKYPGGHGDTELMHCISAHLHQEVCEIWYAETGPFDVDVLLIGGGFPCRESKSIQTCLEHSSALRYINEFAASGKYIIGINSGFHLLCELDLLPGMLEDNTSKKFVCKYVFVKPENQHTIMTEQLDQEEAYYIPVATYRGKYRAGENDLVEMRQEGQILFRYCDHEGRITESVNYLGSTDNIAAICNRDKNVFGIIPQPERALVALDGKGDGYRILDAVIKGVNSKIS